LSSVVIGREVKVAIIGEISEGVAIEVHLDVVVDHARDLTHHGGDVREERVQVQVHPLHALRVREGILPKVKLVKRYLASLR
jgi:hypothetical protein